MLVLARKVGEKFVIGKGKDAVVLCLLGINRNGRATAAIGIDAPFAIKVYREEVFLAIKKSEETAT